MNGLEAVEISLRKIKIDNAELRIDSEYFSKIYLSFDKKLDNVGSCCIEEFASVTDGIHASIDFDDVSNINLLSAKSPKNNFFDLSANGYISEKQHYDNPRTALKVDDIIISTVGTIGNCAVVEDNILPANCDRHVGIIRINERYKAKYLSTFLLSKYGLYQSKRHSTGNVQLNLFIYKIKNIKAPFISTDFQEKIANTVIKARKLMIESKDTYAVSEALMLSHLGLTNYTPSKKSVAIKSFNSSFGATGRLDSEYYQPKYDEIIKVLKDYKSGFTTLQSFISDYSTGFPYKSDEYCDDGEVSLIRINNISKGTLDISNSAKLLNPVALQSPKDFVKIGDVLISMSGTIGNSCSIVENIKAVVNQRIFKITPQNINSNVLALFINSILGYYQLERIGTGGVQTNISGNDIKNILIPYLGDEIQSEIAEKIQHSFALRKKSVELLDLAKTAVEVAIEQGEDSAMELLSEKGVEK